MDCTWPTPLDCAALIHLKGFALPIRQPCLAMAVCACRLVHIAVGTPGRLLQLTTEGALVTEHVSMFVLDEADALLGDNFYSDVTLIYDELPKRKQVRLGHSMMLKCE